MAAAPPARAARSIAGPAGFSCNADRTLAVQPPRIWAGDRTEQVVWVNMVQRWDGTGWVAYGTYYNWSSFNVFGQQVTHWIGNPPLAYGSFVNNRLHLRLAHPGYYRTGAMVKGYQGGEEWLGWVAEAGWCYVA